MFLGCCDSGTGLCNVSPSGELYFPSVQVLFYHPFVQSLVDFKKKCKQMFLGAKLELLTIHIMDIEDFLAAYILYANDLGQWPVFCFVHPNWQATSFHQGGLKDWF